MTTGIGFKIASQSAAFTAGETIAGLTSNATGTYVIERATPSASETYMRLDGVSGTFQASEVVQGGTSGATSTIGAILTTAGVIEKGEAYKDSTFIAGVTIDGSTTDAGHYMWLTAEPSSRHTGVAGTGVKIEGNRPQIINHIPYSIIEWMEVSNTYTGGSLYYVFDYFDSGVNGIIRDNIIHSLKGDIVSVGLHINATIYNNIIYGMDGGVWATSNQNIYNNTFFDNGYAVQRDSSGTPLLRNNISASSTIDYDINGGSRGAA